MKEIRIHGRGGQGIVTSGKLLVNSVVNQGMEATCLPEYGAERRGGPVIVHIRVNSKKIQPKTKVYHPRYILLVDPEIKPLPVMLAGIEKNGVLIVNTKNKEIKERIPDEVKKIGVINASEIAEKYIGTNIASIPMLGSLSSISEWLALESLKKSILDSFPGDISRKNVKAVVEGFRNVDIWSN